MKEIMMYKAGDKIFCGKSCAARLKKVHTNE